MKAAQAYESAIYLECTCTSINIKKWEKLMNGAVKANGSKIRSMIKKQIPDLYYNLALEYPNPYESKCQRTDEHLIYVHSGIEYFLKMV